MSFFVEEIIGMRLFTSRIFMNDPNPNLTFSHACMLSQERVLENRAFSEGDTALYVQEYQFFD